MALARTLTALDGRSYGDYKRILGTHPLDLPRAAELLVDRVQVDPYAPPSLMRVRLPLDETGRAPLVPADLLADAAGRIATGDFLARSFAAAALTHAGGERRNRRRADHDQPPPIGIGTPGQEVLERTSVVVTPTAHGAAPTHVEARITVQLPAAGRRIRGRQAAELLTAVLPRIVADSLLRIDADALRDHVVLYRDQLALQSDLTARGLVAFVGDGAILPRRAGDSDQPLVSGAVPFRSPDSLRVSVDLPSGRRVTGMGVPAGVTVIIGGGYHGKSTLLRAIERGIHPHIAGDGRTWVLTRPDAAAIRAEDGRSVASTDISPFISGLPSGTDTRAFSTTNASGSTSQAANLIEAVDSGATALLIDEDTSATNFMIRDARMRRIIPADREPITPFVDRVRPLHRDRGVSTILVAGGSGAFFEVADHVIALDAYGPRDVTEQARAIAAEDPSPPVTVAPEDTSPPTTPLPPTAPHVPVLPPAVPRVPAPGALRPADTRKFARARGLSRIQFGREDIDLSAVSQLVDPAQTQAIAGALEALAHAFAADPALSIGAALTQLDARLESEGLESLAPQRGHPGHLARPRMLEVAAALNRVRGLTIRSHVTGAPA